MALYQQELNEAISVPILSSSLVLLPMILATLSKEKTVGIITGDASVLNDSHFSGVGVASLDSIWVEGMETQPHFAKVVLTGEQSPDYHLMKKDVLSAVGNALRKKSNIGAILLECSNLASFSRDISEAFLLPVYDMNWELNILHRLINQRDYT